MLAMECHSKKATTEVALERLYHPTERIPLLVRGPQVTPSVSGPLRDRLLRAAESFGNRDFRRPVDLGAERIAPTNFTPTSKSELMSGS